MQKQFVEFLMVSLNFFRNLSPLSLVDIFVRIFHTSTLMRSQLATKGAESIWAQISRTKSRRKVVEKMDP